MENKIAEYRLTRGLSPQDLSQESAVRLERLLRVEAGVWPASLDEALALATALGVSIRDIFPRAADALRQVPIGGDVFREVITKPDIVDGLAKAGIDAGARRWLIQGILRNGARFEYNISKVDTDSLDALLANSDGGSPRFFSFNSYDYVVAINPAHLSVCKVAWEPPDRMAPGGTPEEDLQCLRVWLAGGVEPLRFDVDSDANVEGGTLEHDDVGQLEAVLLSLEDDSGLDFVQFEDGDRELVYIRKDAIALFELPHWVLHPELSPFDEENEQMWQASSPGSPIQ